MQDNDGAVARLHNVLLLVVYRYGLLSSYRDTTTNLHPKRLGSRRDSGYSRLIY